MKDKHYAYTKGEIRKQLALLELHGKNNPCPDCISKHLTTIEGLAEEGTLQTDNTEERLKFLRLAENARNMRKLQGLA